MGNSTANGKKYPKREFLKENTHVLNDGHNNIKEVNTNCPIYKARVSNYSLILEDTPYICAPLRKNSERIYCEDNRWTSYFFSECDRLRKTCGWAQKLSKKLKKFKGSPSTYYISQVQFINHMTKIFSDDDPESDTSSFSSNKSENIEKENPVPPASLIDNLDNIETMLESSAQGTGLPASSSIQRINSNCQKGNSIMNSQQIPRCHYLDEMACSKDTKPNSFFKNCNKIERPKTLSNINKEMFVDLINNQDKISNLPVLDLDSVDATPGKAEPGEDPSCLEKKTPGKLRKTFEHYKKVLLLMNHHLNDPTQKLAHVLTCFKNDFKRRYALKKCDFERQSKMVSGLLEASLRDIQQFIRLIQECLSRFYKLMDYRSHVKGHFLFSKEHLIHFVTNVTFADEEIYNLIFLRQKSLDERVEGLIEENIKKFPEITPEKFGISSKFCLNKSTIIEYFSKLKNKSEHFNLAEFFKQENIAIQDRKNSCDLIEIHCLSPDWSSRLTSPSSIGQLKLSFHTRMESVLSQFEEEVPYEKCIQVLKKLETDRSPCEKLKTIIRSSELIMTCIREFYSKYNLCYNEKIDGDEILAIYVYMVSKAGISNLTTHCKLIERFLTNQVAASICGYYFVTLQASVKYLEEM